MTHELGILFRRFWRLARPYWRSEERWAARGLLAVVIALNLGLVFINVQFNQWNKTFYDALQELDAGVFWYQLGVFTILAFCYIGVGVYQVYLNQMLQIRWRRWLTHRFVEGWLAERVYYRMQLDPGRTDNPDQRLTEDARDFVRITLALGLGFMNAIVTLASFLAILWSLSGSGSFTVFGTTITVPGYMVWAALLYATFGTLLTAKVGWPLVMLNFNQQRFEADFRYALVRARENTEGVALLGGEAREREGFFTRFVSVVENYRGIMLRQKKLNALTYCYTQVAVIFPFLVASPRYFAKEIQLGGLMQTASAFGQVHDSLSFIVTGYAEIANWRAIVTRLAGFIEAVDGHALAAERPAIAREAEARTNVSVQALDLVLPTGRTLIADLSLEIAPRDRLLVKGPSGCGKSTLFRALAGIWPFGTGRVRVPAGRRIMVLPQRPYLPLGTLRRALAYPGEPHGFEAPAFAEVLKLCGLAHLAPRLDEEENWGQTLSGGEQQRVAWARVLLHKPDFVFLDEASAALDVAAEERLYAALLERLPESAIVSIAHRPAVARFHSTTLDLGARAAAA